MDSTELRGALQEHRLGESIAALEKSRADSMAENDSRQTARVSNDLGVIYYLSARYAESRAALELARDQFIRLEDRAGQARALGNLARLDEKTGNAQAALPQYQQAADLLHEAREPEDEFATLRSLSQLFMKRGAWLHALASYDRALTIRPRKTWFDGILHTIYQIPLRMMGMSPR
jgi:tetratricopeptide (TPR) repeat protein